MVQEQFTNNAITTLNGGITALDLSLVVTSAASFPAIPQFRLNIEGELMLVTGVVGNTFTVTRGIEGTIAAPHGNLVQVRHIITAEGLTTLLQPKLGNVLLVDQVNGDDGTGVVNGPPFATVDGALAYIVANALTGVTVWVMPGVYDLAAGIAIPDTCAIRGLNTQTVTLQMLNVVAPTTLLTMGEQTRIEDVTLTLTSAAVVDLVGVHFPGTTSVTSKVRPCTITVDNHTVGTGTVTNVYGVLSDGTGVGGDLIFAQNCIRGSVIQVISNGDGLKVGVYQPAGGGSANQMSARDTNIYVAVPADPASIGTYTGVYCDNDASMIQLRTSSVLCRAYEDLTHTSTVRIALGANLALTGTPTVQGLALIAGDRVLATQQTSAINNGVYVVAAGAWARAADLPIGANANDYFVFVSAGLFANQSFLCVSAPAVVGTHALTFVTSFVDLDTKLPALARYTGGAPTGARAAQGAYTPADGDRFFLDAATSAVDNGIWVYNSTGAWTRALDMPVGSNADDAYVLIRSGTDANKAYICTTVGTVGTDALTFIRKYLSADILQNAPATSVTGNGIQLGAGTDLVSRSAGAQPFSPFATSQELTYSLRGSIVAGSRWLWPGVQTTVDTIQQFYRFQQRGIVTSMTVNVRVSPGPDTVVISVLKSISGLAGSGVPTGMQISFTDGILRADQFSTSVDFERGTFMALQIDSTGGVTNIDMTVEVNIY
jgi:hypothetical protein